MIHPTTLDAIAIENRARALRAEVTRTFFANLAARLRGTRVPARTAHA